MTTYTAIVNGRIDTDSPLDQSLFTDLRDNPIAISEGAPGAPRIMRGAIAAGVGHRWFFDYGDGSDGPQSWTTAGGPYALGLWQCTTFAIAAGETPTFDAHLGPLIICATTSITINGTLNMDGKGSRGGYNAGTGSHELQGQQGMFGASGGAGSAGTDGGGVYMVGNSSGAGSSQSARDINTLLSLMPILIVKPRTALPYYNENVNDVAVGGGGGGSQNTTSRGGDGGGLIVLCSPSVTVGAAGVITADGTAPYLSTNSGGGGGGAIIIATPSGGYTNTGSVAAAGGASGGTGGDGGTGWVKEVILT